MAQVLFRSKNLGRIPSLTFLFMAGVFGLPALALPAMTWREVPESPILLLVYVWAFFPLAVLYVLNRLFRRYGLVVYEDGTADIIYPFSTVRFRAQSLARVFQEQWYVAATKSHQYWLRFVDREGKLITSLSPLPFESSDLQNFLENLRKINPELTLQ